METWKEDMAKRIDLTKADMFSMVQVLGADAFKHADLIEDMYWDGHSPQDVVDAISLIENGDMLDNLRLRMKNTLI